MALDFLEKMDPAKKRTFIMNFIRYVNLFMLVLGFVLIIYFASIK
jgi:hypothetical protein